MTDPKLADCVLVLVTIPIDDMKPSDFARELVATGVAACVSVMPPMESTYRWQGEVESAPEQQVLIKTTAANVAALWQRVQDLHPYDVPEFIVLPIIDGNEAYLKWVRESVL